MKIFAAITAASFLALAACSAPEPSSTTTGDALTERSDACVALDRTLDEAVAKAPKDASYDALLSVTTADCPASFHTAGPSALDAHSLVRIGSVTKSYVSVVTLRAVADGKIALDGRLDAYLPDAPAAIAAITIRELLQHTSGIFSYTDTPEFWTAKTTAPMQAWTPRELVDLALTKPAYFAPGAGWQYSNTNYIVLGMMLEHLEGAPIASLIRDQILVPNGLHDTFFESGEPLTGTLAPGFDKNGLDISHGYSTSWAWSAGAMTATVEDAARFIELLGRGDLLPPAVQAEMVKGVDIPQHGVHYGLGVFLIDAALSGGAGPGIGHGGDIFGFHSSGFYFPEKKMTIFGVVNSDRGIGDDVLGNVLIALAPHAG